MAARRPPRPRLELTGREAFDVAWELMMRLRERMKHAADMAEQMGKPGALAWLCTPEEQAQREDGVARARLALLKILRYGHEIGYLTRPAADTLADWMAEAEADEQRVAQAVAAAEARS
jgi:hypothetical protein